MQQLRRLLLPFVLGGLLLLVFVTPVMAIEPPDDLDISGVWVYRNCRQENDQMYLVHYSINYTTNPTESATTAYLVRLMDGSTELAYALPFAYYNNGYGEGVVAIYFDADSAPTWQGAYSIQLVGNPFLGWNGTIPTVSYASFDLWQDNTLQTTQIVLSGRIIDLGDVLETAWGQEMTTESDTGQDVLTAFGLGYFQNVIPYMADVAPYVYPSGLGPSGVIDPDIPEEWERTDYADSLVVDIIGTPFDMTAMATSFGVSRGAMSAILYYGCVAVALILFIRRIGSYKPVMLFSIPLVILGAFLGVPLIVTILCGLLALGMTAYVLFYSKSTA